MALVRRTWWQSVVRVLASILAKQNPVNGDEQQLFTKLEMQVNTDALARDSSLASLIALFEILLFCVVQSPSKKTYVYKIMQLPPHHQKSMMAAIQRVAAQYPIAAATQAASEPSSVAAPGTLSRVGSTKVVENKQKLELLKSERDQLLSERVRAVTCKVLKKHRLATL